MATRSSKGSFWQLENGKYFVPTVDQVGGWNPEAPMVDANGRLMADERGNLIPMSAPQQPYSVRDAKGAWLAKGEGGTPYTYTGVLPGFGGSTPTSISGTLYDSPLSESYVASNIEGGGLDMPGLSILGPFAAGYAGLSGGLGNLFSGGGSGGGMSWFDSLTNGLSNFFGGGEGVIPATEWPSSNFWSGGAGSGAGNILWDQGLWNVSGDMINATQWPSNMWSGQVGGGTPMVSWDGAAPVPFSTSGLNLPNGVGQLLQQGLSGGSGLGALLGALAGGIGASSKPAGTTTSVQDIPDYLKPYQSMNLASGVQNFANANAGQSLLPGSQQYMQKTINGDFLDPNQNPAFQPYVKDLMGQAGANYAGLYGKNPDNLNNSGFQEGYTRAITNAVLPLYNSAFQTAQGNQYNAASNAPQYAGNVANAALAPNLAFKNLYTGPQATSQPYFTNPLGGALSGGLAGYQFGNSIFGSKN